MYRRLTRVASCRSRIIVPSRRASGSALPAEATVVRYNKHGDPNEDRAQNEPLPAMQDNSILLQMALAPINPADLNMVIGNYPIGPELPAIGGNEGLGIVRAIGRSVRGLQEGDFVIPKRPGFGTWRTHAVCDEQDVLKIPRKSNVKPEYYATLSVNPATAYRMLNDFVDLKEGDVVIQNGANGMVGMSVIQLAALKKVKTINIIRKRSDYDNQVTKMKQYGGYIAIADDYLRTPEFRKLISDLPKPKLALNCVGGPTATEMARLLQREGTMVTYGGMSMKPVTVPTGLLIFNDIRLRGFWMSRWYEEHSEQERLDLFTELVNLADAGKLRLWIERHPFSKFKLALDRAINTNVRDRKVVLQFLELDV